MASENAKRFLEALQESIYSDLGLTAEMNSAASLMPMSNEIIEKTLQARAGYTSPADLEKLRKELLKVVTDELAQKLPTKYENPGWYSVLIDLAETIESAADEMSLRIPPRPLLGTLPTGQVNAMTILVPSSDEHLIVFESQLFLFALLMSKAVVRAFPFENSEDHFIFSTDEEKIHSNIDANPEVAQRFFEVLAAYVIEGRPGAAPQYIPPEPWGTMAGHLRNSMEIFVLGHEYGHLISGHLAEGRGSAALLGHKDVDRLVYSWNQEFEADRWGLQLMIPAIQRFSNLDISLSFWGADFFFSCVDIVGKAVAVLTNGNEESAQTESHPPPHLRRQFIRQILANSLPEEEAKGPIDLAQTLQVVTERLWGMTKPAFYRLHRAGNKPAPSWL